MTERHESRATTTLRVANAKGVPGTAGALVHGDDGRPLMLTTHHVLYGDGAGRGDIVWALRDDGTPATPAGRAGRSAIGRVIHAGRPCFVDCAVVELGEELERPPWLRAVVDGLPRLRATAPAAVGMAVAKDGAVTGPTRGLIADTDYYDHPFVAGQRRRAPGQLLVRSTSPELVFSGSGDSGALVRNDRGEVVGLLWGSTGAGHGVACPIAPVLEWLGVHP